MMSLSKSREATEVSAQSVRKSAGQTAPRVLVVEDEASLSLLLAYNLEAEGYLVERAERGDEAELKLAEAPPDLVILDWMLPGVSGLEICRRLRARAKTFWPKDCRPRLFPK